MIMGGSCLLIIILIFTLGSGALEASSYIEYVENPENGLRKTVETPLYSYTLQYQPAEYATLLEARELKPSTQLISEGREKRSGLQYFVFKIQSKDGQDITRAGNPTEEEVQQRDYYFSTIMNEDFKLVEAGDTLNCAIWHFERNYGLAPYNNVVVTFENRNMGAVNRIFVYKDPFQGGAPVTFNIQSEDLAELPQVKTYE